MKRIKLILYGVVGMLLGSACSDSAVPESASEPWNVTISRSGGETVDEAYSRILILGKQGDDKKLKGVLEVNGTTGSWENNSAPTWPNDGTGDMSLNLYAVSPVPENNELPTEINLTGGQGTAWQVDFHSGQTKPSSLTLSMEHVLAKLVVHIRIDGETNPQPTGASIRLYAKGEIVYPGKKVTTTDKADVPLGEFHQEGQDDHSTEHNWETEAAIVVIPQEIPAGEPCLWFTAGGRKYTFTPLTPLKLEVGKVNNLYLGVAVGGPVMLQSVTVTDWTDGGTIDAGEAEETDGV